MKRKIVLVLALMLMFVSVHSIYADITKMDITFESVQPASQLATLLRSKIDHINAEINQKSLNVGTGNIFYVDSAVGSDSYTGIKPAWALESLDAVFDTGYCTADNGDVVYVMQGHSETKSDSGALITFDVNGVTIICLGNGDSRAKFTLSHTGAKIDITANNVRFSNFYLDATGITSVNTPLNITGKGCILDGFFIRLSDTIGQADLGITIGSVDNDANDLIIANGIIVAPDAGAVSAILFATDQENVILSNLRIYGDFSAAGIEVVTNGNAQENLSILDCIVLNEGGADHAIEINGTGNTGVIDGCTLISDAEATILDAGGLQMANTDLLMIGNSEGAALPASMTLVDLIGDFTGPDSGTAAGENIKALLDLILADTGTTLEARQVLILEDTATSIPLLINNLTGIGLRGTCESNAGANGEVVICAELGGFGEDYFNTGWSMICIMDDSGAGSGAAPEGEIIDIIDYATSSGTFTLNIPFSTELDASDEIMLKRTEELELDVPTTLGASGNIWYVDAGTGATGDGSGKTWENADATILLAIASAAANNGDVIYIAAGHSETITAGYAINKAGLSFIGIGEGDLQPTMVFNSSTAAQWNISVANILIKNIKFEADLANILICLDVAAGADGLHVEDCRFVSTADADKEFLQTIVLATDADDVLFEGCEFISVGGGATECFFLENVVDNLQIKDCWIFGDYSVAPIWSDAIQTNILIKDNVITQLTSGQYAIEFTSTASGNLVDNRINSPLYDSMLLPGSLICSGNIGTSVLGEQGIAIPTSALTISIAEEDDGSNLERLEYLQNKVEDILAGIRMAGGSIGDVFYCDDGGSAVGAATSWATAETSLKDAYDKASAGDIVFVAPAHSETLGNDQIDFDIAGVTVIGIGDGADMPMIDMQHGSSSFDVTGASNTIKNIHFQSSTAATVIGISVTAADFTIEDCLFTDVSTYQFTISLDLDTEAENCTIRRCRFESITGQTGATSAIAIDDGTIGRLIIEDCHIWGDFDNGGIYSDKANTNALIKNNSITNNETLDHAIELTAAMTGDLINNMLSADLYGSVLDPGSMRCFGNMQTVGIDAAAEDVPLVAGKSYARVMLLGDLTTTQNLFSVTGSPIIVTSFVGKATVACGGTTTLKINVVATDSWHYDISDSVDVATVDQGGLIVFDATATESALSVQTVGTSGSMGPSVHWWVEEGMLTSTVDTGGSTGNIEWYMIFTPVESGCEVIPQAGT